MSNVDTEAPRDYARLISKTDPEGYAFWTPYTEGVIGDCGIVRPDGQFVKLFNVFAEGTGFACLPTAEPRPTHVPAVEDLVGWPTPADSAERRIRIENNTSVWRAQESIDWSVEVEAPVPILAGNLGFGFTISQSKGLAAFLAPCGSKRRIETYLMDQVFPVYLKRNYKAICARYSSMYDMSTVCILEGTTHATSWCRGFTRQHGRSIHGIVSVDPIPGVPVFKVECGHGQTMNHPWMIAAGPSEQPPDRKLHLIRARLTVHHSKRPKWLQSWSLQRISAADTAPVGPACGGSNSSVGGTMEGRPISSYTSAGSSVGEGHQAVDQLAAAFESHTIAAQSNSADAIRGSDLEDSPNEPEVYAPNFVQMILDAVLEAYPEYDSIIVNWRVLQAFWDSCGSNSAYDHSLLLFDIERISDSEDRAAFINKIGLCTPVQSPIGPAVDRLGSPTPERRRVQPVAPIKPSDQRRDSAVPVQSNDPPTAIRRQLPLLLRGLAAPFQSSNLRRVLAAPVQPSDSRREPAAPVQLSDRRSFQLTIGPLLLDGWADPLLRQATFGISYIPPQGYNGLPSTLVPITAPPLPLPLAYPTMNPHGGQPTVHTSVSGTLVQTPTFPVRGTISGAARANAHGQMCFTIRYQLRVRNSHGGETPLTGMSEAVLLE